MILNILLCIWLAVTIALVIIIVVLTSDTNVMKREIEITKLKIEIIEERLNTVNSDL